MLDHSGSQFAKFKERIAENKARSERFHVERFNLKTLNEVEGNE
jgi:hypothetical protein